MLSILFLGFLIGMQHALEADHVAAVSSLVARESSVGRAVRHGTVWGIGHTVTLMGFAGAAVLLNAAIGHDMALWLERGVGVMLVALGGHLLYRLWRDRIHFHTHRHADGKVHFHAHSHAGESGSHRLLGHDHTHARGIPFRTLLVGMMHGMAGSAALLVLSTAAVDEPALGMTYIVFFALGSVLGMALLSALIALPLALASRFLTLGSKVIQGAVGAGTVAFGVVILT
ncbi:MAG: urease accessory protein [Alphaproteobacteria bacterium]|nr:urease accessory protein [Alphaproteobacteria bacterium]